MQNYLLDPAAKKNLKVEVKVDPAASTYISADPPRITQVLWNVLQNACKFTPAGGAITIRVFNAASSADPGKLPDLIVEISDTGIGIEPDELLRIFTAFEQGERSRTRVFGGLGLGLAISRAIAERHDGSLTAASAGRGQGATFILRLPVVPAPVADVPAILQPAPPPAKAAQASRILLVEDHADTAQQLSRLLMREGHEIVSAGTITQAMQLAEENHFDLLVSDLGLPDGSGHDLMHQLGARHGLPGIALSGYGMEEDVKASLAAGFKLHLTKPIHWPELRDAVQQMLSDRLPS